jgi:hypothetical protein
MELAIISDEEATSILKRPVEYGLCSKLMGLGCKAKALRSKLVYGCRHCEQIRKPPAALMKEATASPMEVDCETNRTGGAETSTVKDVPDAGTESPDNSDIAGETLVDETNKPDAIADDPGPSENKVALEKARSNRPKKKPSGDLKLFTFDGLRSHLKGK